MENKGFTKEDIQKEMDRIQNKNKYVKSIRSTIAILVTVVAAAVLVATLWMPVLRIYGDSMTPTLTEGDYVVCVKQKEYKTGDIIAFYYNNRILVKRVITSSGNWVNIDYDGRVYINGTIIDEDYVKEYAYGETNINLPYQVPESKIFVMGDHRETSLDSRNTAIGPVDNEQIVGKLLFCVWPLNNLGLKR